MAHSVVMLWQGSTRFWDPWSVAQLVELEDRGSIPVIGKKFKLNVFYPVY